jgi:hypothetical protein
MSNIEYQNEGESAAIENHFAKLEQAVAKLAAARASLGPDLGGYSITDLLADNFPWSLEQCKHSRIGYGASSRYSGGDRFKWSQAYLAHGTASTCARPRSAECR